MEANDMKTMREALEAILKEANTQYRNDNGIDLEWLMAKAKAALSAPPRNCDRFSVAAEALAEWQRLAHMKPNTWDFRYNYWLFAPAAEKEGGAK